MIGQTLNRRYKITSLLGEGGMGEVYLATDKQTRQPVAVKILIRQLTMHPESLERFRREAETLRKLAHPNIVKFVDAFEHKRQFVIVMEYMPGGSLYQLLKAGPLPIERARRIALELCDALIRSHHLNIIHRDIKPENVLIDRDGTPKLADFGVARLGEFTRMTRSGTQVGTPYYMAPEAWEGKKLDARADIWSLGVMLFEMLAGEVPFDGDSGAAVMNKVLNTEPPDLKKLRTEVPADLVSFVSRMLARNKEQRFQSMREVALELERRTAALVKNGSEKETIDLEMVPSEKQVHKTAKDTLIAHGLSLEASTFVEPLKKESKNLETVPVSREVTKQEKPVVELPLKARKDKPDLNINFRLLRIAGLIMVGLIFTTLGGNYLMQNWPAQSTLEPESQALYLFTAEDGLPTSIRMESKAGEIVEIARDTDNAWAVILPIEAKADQAMAEAAAGQVSILQILDTIPDIDLDIVGLADPEYILTIKFTSGIERKVEIGIITPTESGYYLRDADGGTVIVSKSSLDSLLGLLTNPPYLETPSPAAILGIGSTLTGKDGMTLLYVPAGEFTMGSDIGELDEKPVHTVDLDAFWIDQTEVTNKMYALCVDAGVCREPTNTSSSTHSSYYGNSEFDDYPVIYVDWNMAKTYCEWADRRLPTEGEWEKAARGENAFAYPWGNDFDGTRLNFCDKNCSFDWADKSSDDGFADTAPVGNYSSGASPYGALDMAGNVWEWVADRYDVYLGGDRNASSDFGQKYKVLRGGSWDGIGSSVRTALRYRLDSDLSTGFRCSRSP